MSPKLETLITGGTTIAAIVGIGAAKQAGIIDDNTATLAMGVALGGGLGWTGKTLANATPSTPGNEGGGV